MDDGLNDDEEEVDRDAGLELVLVSAVVDMLNPRADDCSDVATSR
jgi:hypothetical protein